MKVLCVELHPELELLCDALFPPHCEVRDKQARVKGACRGFDLHLFDVFVLEVDVVSVIVLNKTKTIQTSKA